MFFICISLMLSHTAQVGVTIPYRTHATHI